MSNFVSISYIWKWLCFFLSIMTRDTKLYLPCTLLLNLLLIIISKMPKQNVACSLFNCCTQSPPRITIHPNVNMKKYLYSSFLYFSAPFFNRFSWISGLNRSGKSCRLRWVNYLRPGLKKGQLTPLEEGIIIELHAVLGNK